jgi:hypothetical protein
MMGERCRVVACDTTRETPTLEKDDPLQLARDDIIGIYRR